MDPDLLFVIGLFLAVLAIPSVLSAYSESRPPRLAAILVILAGALIVAAVVQKPGGYRVDQIPNVIFGVIGKLLNS